MSYDTREQAEAKGRVVYAKLKNKAGWGIHVWENSGWHVGLQKEGLNLCIHEYGEGQMTFSTLLSADNTHLGTGEVYWSPGKHFTNPNKAIQHQIEIAEAFVKKCKAAIQKVKK